MKLKLILMAFLVSLFATSFGQTIEIGQEAGKVKQIVEWTTRNHTGYDSYGNSKGNNVISDTKFFNGEISEVIKCYTKQYLIDFKISADFCVHYIMKNGKLFYILTQYENVSVSKLKELFDKSYNEKKLGDLYFSDDFENYSRIYLHKNGLATVELSATDTKNLSPEINRKLIDYEKNKQQELLGEGKRVHAEAEQQRLLDEDRKQQAEKESRKGVSYNLDGRSALSLPKPQYPGNNEGIVIITITVNKEGTVIKVEESKKRSSIDYPELIIAAKKAALQSKFNADNNAPNNQVGIITYRFALD